MKNFLLLSLFSLFSFSAMSATCLVLGPNPQDPGSFDILVASVENAFENEEKTNLVVIKKDGEILINFGAKDLKAETIEEYDTLMKSLDGATAVSFSMNEEGLVSIVSGKLNSELAHLEEGMFVIRAAAHGTMTPMVALADLGLKLSFVCTQ